MGRLFQHTDENVYAIFATSVVFMFRMIKRCLFFFASVDTHCIELIQNLTTVTYSDF